MRDDIKKRIETIRRGEVPEDYIRTEFGVMPKEWRKLLVGDVIEFYSEKSTKNNEYPVLTSSRSGLALQTEYFEGQVTREENAGYNIIPYGYCTFRSRSDDGQFTFNQNTIIDKGIVSCFYPVFRVKEAVAVDTFVLCFLNNYLGRQILKEIVGTSQLVLSEKKLNSLRIAVPPVSEQKKIAKILSVCDRAIELKQKLVEELQSLKKTCLSKMFPRNGENVPELRFPSFTAPWEQRKLGVLVQFSKGTGYSKGDLRESGTPIILYGRLYTKYETVISEVDTFADAKAGSVYSRGGEVIVPASGETAEDISIASVVEKSGVLLGGDLNIITPPADLDAPFLAISISNGKPHEDMAKMAQGKSVVHLHNTDLEKIDLTYPSHEEQKQISGYFGALDRLITLHQRELEEERKRKTTLMRLLLTGIVRVNA